MNKSMSGFTIVELLIVIVVIAILAVISIVAYNGVQNRATVSSFANQLKQVDKSLRLYATSQGWTQWPNENTLVAGVPTAPSINEMIVGTPGLRDYLKTVPTIGGVHGDSWSYDNDADVQPKTACGFMYNGTNVHIGTISQTVAQQIDTTLDDGDLSCGIVRFDTSAGANRLIYAISYNSDL